jgi:hypothetical protein
MKIAIWLLFGAMALAWTAGAWLMAAVAQWSAHALASGTAEAAGRAVAAWPAPPWLAFWFDPQWVKALQDMMIWSFDTAQGLLPWLGTAMGWLVPLVWVGWGFGLVVLLLLAVMAHWGVSRWRPGGLRAASA